MTTNLDVSSTLGSLGQISSVAPATAPALARPGGLDGGPIGGDFAELLTGYILKTERQELTAFATDAVSPGNGLQLLPPSLGLKLLPLGKELNVITSDTPMPDIASVAAFARAQGLGEAAVQALFGPVSPLAVTPLDGGDVKVANWLSMPKTAALTDALLSGQPRNAASANPASGSQTATSDVFEQINTAAYLQANWLSPASTVPIAPAAPAATTQALVLIVPAPTGANRPEAASALDIENAPARPATPSLMTSNLQIDKRLPPLVTADKPAIWSSLLLQASATDKGASQMKTFEDLHLELPPTWSVDDQGTLIIDSVPDQNPVTPAANSATPSLQSAGITGAIPKSEAATLQSQAEQRSVQYQQLADRLGEALSQRLLSQIERGEWKMQMRMQPGGLGFIDVTLDMSAAGLSAMFSSESSVTRELIAQGTARLKSSLEEAGTAVANLWVSGDAKRQPGGNPTPGQAFKETPGTQDKTINATAMSTERIRPATDPSDVTGLDVLA